MQKLKFYIDTHDVRSGTFPAAISTADFAGFYQAYDDACRAEGVISLRIHAGLRRGGPSASTWRPAPRR
jgi:hypothetical protein